MKKVFSSRIVICLLLVFCSVIVGVVVLATSGQDAKRLHIENKTNSLKVVSVKDIETNGENTRFAITVKNASEKAITAYSFGISDNKTNKDFINRIEINGTINNWSLQPNDTNVTPFSASSEGEIMLTIVAVMFEDGSGEGLSNDLIQLQEIRAGAMLAFRKIMPILKSIENEKSENYAPDSFIESIKGKIALLNDNEVSANLRRGFVQAKNYYALELTDLKNKTLSNPNFNSRAEIINKIAKIEGTLAKQ